jgi:hypothetical protein
LASLLAAALTRAQSFLLEPVDVAEARRPHVADDAGGARRQIEVSVLGMTPRCGTSTVAAGLVLMLSSTGRLAASVKDGGSSASARQEAVIDAADVVVLVSPGSGQPAIVELVASLLRERFDKLVLVANKVGEEDRWTRRVDLCLPEARLAAALVARGRRPPGPFGVALARLAALVERAASQ